MDWYNIFPKIVNMNITAGITVLAVLLARLLLRRAPKVYSYVLWSVVLFRLLCPFSLPAPVSLFNIVNPGETESAGIATSVSYITYDEPDFYDKIVIDPNTGAVEDLTEDTAVLTGSPNIDRTGTLIVTILWYTGVVIMVVHGILSYFRLKQKLIGAVPVEKGIWQTDYISVPFALGMLRPRIYLPSVMEEEEREYVLLHERYHVKHFDHVVKCISYAALCIHWFNPLVWLAFVLAEKDMEMRCDEGVLRQLGDDARQDYSASLLHFSAGHKRLTAVSPAFSEGGIKTRIRNILNWKKPSKKVSAAAMILCAVILAGCALNPEIDTLEVGEEFTHILWNSQSYPIENMTDHPVYVSADCLYIHPFSSTLTNGDTGYRYIVTENSFSMDNRMGTTTVLNDSITWEWEEFPWTNAEWNDLFFPSFGMRDIYNMYDEILYKKLNRGYFLLRVDGCVWLVHTNKNPDNTPYIWSIHSLKPESVCGLAMWEYKPQYSSLFPAFAFSFAPEPSEISVFSYGGTLIDRAGSKDVQDVYLRYAGDSTVYWVPRDEENQTVGQAKLDVAITYEGRFVFGNIYIQSMGENLYSATIVGSGLRMEQSEEFPGGVIVWENPQTAAGIE
ncbi:MAG: hypothetical protein IJ325_06300 [Clostridia bacterium]|nr:hypothetical protein [Clostridia bacterium]